MYRGKTVLVVPGVLFGVEVCCNGVPNLNSCKFEMGDL